MVKLQQRRGLTYPIYAQISDLPDNERIALHFAMHPEDRPGFSMRSWGRLGARILAMRREVDEVFGEELDASELSSDEQAELNDYRRETLLAWLWPLDGESAPLAEAAGTAMAAALDQA